MTRAVAKVLLGLLLGLSLAAPAADGEGRQKRPPVFSTHDLDRDGYIDRREYYQFRQRVRARRGPGRHGARLYDFQELDRDGDGRVEREELIERLSRDRADD